MIWTIIAILSLIIALGLFVMAGFVPTTAKGKVDGKRVAIRGGVQYIAVILAAFGSMALFNEGNMRRYLTEENPAILKVMAQNMQGQEQRESSQKIKKYVAQNHDSMTKNAPIFGNVEGKKTVYMFCDYSCPYCKRVWGELQKVMDKDAEVRVVLKNFSIHGDLSDFPAQASIAARMQGHDKAGAFNKLLWTKGYMPKDMRGDNVAKDVKKNVLALAKEAGLDVKKLEADSESEVVMTELISVRQIAREFAIGGTPFLIVGEEAFPGAVPESEITKALKK